MSGLTFIRPKTCRLLLKNRLHINVCSKVAFTRTPYPQGLSAPKQILTDRRFTPGVQQFSTGTYYVSTTGTILEARRSGRVFEAVFLVWLAHLREEIARPVDNLGLPRETVGAVNKPNQLYYASYSVQVA